LPGVLAVDVEQLLAHGAQLLGSGRAAIDPGAAFALQIDRAAQQQYVVRIKACFLQQGLDAGGGIKFCRHIGAAGAFADNARVGTRASDQLQGVNQDRLAGAGFARQHRKTAFQVQLQFADDDKISQNNAS
jgi:hypothetical protein